MTRINIKNYFVMSILILSASSMAQSNVFGDSTSNFGILASTYTNTSPGTLIAGDLGYTTGPVLVPSISGSTHVADSAYSQAGTAQSTATSFANSQVCTTNLGTSVNLSLVHGGVYTPGVYCITGAASIGPSGITLSGDGIYIFKIGGALTTAANSVVTLNGAQASDVSWVPTQATTLGANTQFAGIILDASGVTMSSNVSMTGRVLAFGGTVSTNADIITVPSYAMADTTSGNLPCTVTFPTGTIDLGSNVRYPAKVYPPGVYCIDGIANIGSGPITLTGNGNHIFKINGALNQAANTDVILVDGAQVSSVIWVPTGPITIGANSHLIGTVNGAPITIGANSDINGIGPAKVMADKISNSQCTVTFPIGTIDLGSNVQYPDKVYPPGVYCIDGAANIGSGPITLSGSGAHIFKINGAFNQAANTDVILSNGAQASSVIWVPTGPITIGANSHLIGTVNGAPITIGANSDINGIGPAKVMADKISNSQCTVTFPIGTIDLGSNVQYPDKVYPPGVYCIDGAANIGSGPITLSGSGAHIFKINGAFNQAANTDVILSNGAQASSVIWVPTGPITIGANSHLIGTVNGAPITIGANSDINGIGPAKVMADKISNSQCTVTFPIGTIDLGSNVQYPDKVYPPGVYCIDGAANIGSGPITLSGSGAHIFKINGALNQAANTDVILSTGAQSASIIWIPAGAVTIGANSHLIGTVNGAPITIGANSDINGIGPAKVMADKISNSQCTVTFPIGTIDLGSNVQYPDKVYPPGVYCIDGAANIGSGPITLSGSGAHIFKINGALSQAANTDVILSNGALSSGVIWVPTGSITIGANSNLVGTVNGAPITIGANSDINGVGPKIMADAISGNFGILASTYTNTSPGTSISGDLGYTTGPAMPATIDGVIHKADSTYSQAGIAQNVATSFANSQVCTTNLGTSVNLSLVHGGVYTPGVYCITGAASIGPSGITLSGDGIYIFKIGGALTTAANSVVTLNGAQASDVSWVPTQATTLGANTQFAGIILDASGVTMSSNVSMTGRVLAFGGTVSTNADIITVPSYAMADTTSGNLPCTVTFPTGTIDLGSNVRYPAKVYPPGVYCIDGIANIGSGPITLTGNGNHIFKINGALNQAANTDVILVDGAQVSSVIWVPTGPITIGANSHLIGTVNGAPITIGANSDINGIGPAKVMADKISNSQCTVTFPIGTIDLGSNVQYPDKVYPPGVYCIDGAANIGSGPITLSGSGAHIFKINGAFNQAANTDVILSNGALSSSVIWVPTGPITIGANSNLIGTVNGAPITIGANSDINGIGPKIMADAISGNFGILASTYSNTSPGTSISGDLGYTTGPAIPATIDGIIHVADSVYSQAGTIQDTATSFANSQVCTTNLGTSVDLSLIHNGVYTPGVYCVTGAASIGVAGITLSGNGIYIFQIDGALTTVEISNVRLANGAQAASVSWVPTGATTLGANSHFAGTILDASGVTIGNHASVTGRVLAFGGTVSTDT